MKCTSYLIVISMMLVLVFPRISKSQQDPSTVPNMKNEPQPSSFRDKEIHEMIEMLREIHLFRELQLSEEKTTAVIQKMRDIRALKKTYLVKRYSLENELEVLLNYAVPEQDKINAILQTLETVKYDYYQQILEADKELQDLLTPEERAKYVLFQRNFNQKLKEIILSIRKESIHPPQKQNQILRKQPAESVIRQKNE